jgi:hypothetical protein
MPRDIKCFVIMPFSESTAEHTEAYWIALFENFLKPLIEENPHVEAFRSAPRREDVLGEIIKNLVTQNIVVADLTDHNPNVFWELGVRQSFQHRTITVAEFGTKIPFDLGKKGTLFYNIKNALKNEQFRRELKFAVQDCIDNPDRPDSPILEAVIGRGSLFEIIRKEEVRRRIYALKSEFDNNSERLERVLRIAKENIEIRKKIKLGENVPRSPEFITGRFRYPSVELLVANRYFDAPDGFYPQAEKYFDDLHQLNDQLRIWETKSQETEQYFREVEKDFTKEFKLFAEALQPFLE